MYNECQRKRSLHVQVVPFSSKSWLSAQAHTRPAGMARQRVPQPPLFMRHILSPAEEKKGQHQRALISTKRKAMQLLKRWFLLNAIPHQLPFNSLFLYFIFLSPTQQLELQSCSTPFRVQDTFFLWDIHGHMMYTDMLFILHLCGYSQIPPE